MGNQKRTGSNELLGIFVFISILIVILIGVGRFIVDWPISPISPLRLQAVEEKFDNLNGEGEIKWYENFFTWNPLSQAGSYPFITGTITIHWQDIEVGIMPVAVPYTTTQLIVELELRGTKTYTQNVTSRLQGALQPDSGVFDTLIWIWIDIEPGEYDEYIKAYWQAGNERIPVQLVRDGQVVQPITNFVLYRENLIIPQLIYLPVVMK